MDIDLTKKQINEAVNEEYRNDGIALFQLIDECTTTYEPVMDVFLRLAKQLKDADRLDEDIYKAITDYVA